MKKFDDYIEERDYLYNALTSIRALVDKQAEDDGLWFTDMNRTAPEAYLQQELRRLHALIEELT